MVSQLACYFETLVLRVEVKYTTEVPNPLSFLLLLALNIQCYMISFY